MNLKRLTIILIIFLVFIGFSFISLDACTNVLVTKGASKDGSTLISYSCDGEFHPHIRILPAADYKPGEMLEITDWNSVKGKIPQVPHTYKVVGLINEFQLAIARPGVFPTL